MMKGLRFSVFSVNSMCGRPWVSGRATECGLKFGDPHLFLDGRPMKFLSETKTKALGSATQGRGYMIREGVMDALTKYHQQPA